MQTHPRSRQPGDAVAVGATVAVGAAGAVEVGTTGAAVGGTAVGAAGGDGVTPGQVFAIRAVLLT